MSGCKQKAHAHLLRGVRKMLGHVPTHSRGGSPGAGRAVGRSLEGGTGLRPVLLVAVRRSFMGTGRRVLPHPACRPPPGGTGAARPSLLAPPSEATPTSLRCRSHTWANSSAHRALMAGGTRLTARSFGPLDPCGKHAGDRPVPGRPSPPVS